MAGILEGIRVLDLGRYIAIPFGGVLLADMGAEVIRLEKPEGEEDRAMGPLAPNGESLFYIANNRNKKGITLNLQSPQGREIFQQLVRHSDVVLENFTLEAARHFGLDYETLKAVNPRIILASVKGFGSDGPYAHKPAFDPIAQALSGAMSYTGFPGGPPLRSGVPYVDYGTALYAALSVVLALYHRQRTGVGQKVDLALFDTATSFVISSGVAAEYKIGGVVRPQVGNHSFYGLGDLYQAKDGWVFISGVSDGIWRRLLRILGREDLGKDPRFKSDTARYLNRDLLRPVVAQWVGQRRVSEAIEALEKGRVPCGRVNNSAEMVADPQVQARQMLIEVEQPGIGKVPVAGSALKLSAAPVKVERAAPALGQDNEEIYGQLLGYGPEVRAQWKAEGVI